MAHCRLSQAGIALLSAILITLTATAVIVSISHEEAFTFRKTSRILLMDRARLYALGLEDWAQIFLQKDRKDTAIDHLGEDWAISIPGYRSKGVYYPDLSKTNRPSLTSTIYSYPKNG